MNLKRKGKKGNSSIEYAFLIALVIGALIGMQAYLKGSVSQRWRLAGDAFGFGRQYAGEVVEQLSESKYYKPTITKGANGYCYIKFNFTLAEPHSIQFRWSYINNLGTPITSTSFAEFFNSGTHNTKEDMWFTSCSSCSATNISYIVDGKFITGE